MTGSAEQTMYAGGSAALPESGWAGRTAEAERRPAPVRRRGNLLQGQALETLGHAVEYLQDARIFELDSESAAADREAIQLLKRASRAVFAECPEVVSLGDRIARWVRTGWARWVDGRHAA